MSTITVRIGRSGQDAEVVLTLPAERKESEAILSALDVYRRTRLWSCGRSDAR